MKNPPVEQNTSTGKQVRVIGWIFLVTGLFYLFQTGCDMARAGRIVFDLTFLNLLAGLGLLHYRKFWRIYAIVAAGLFTVFHLLALPAILYFMSRAGDAVSLLWIGGSEQPSCGCFWFIFLFEILALCGMIWSLVILFLPRTGAFFQEKAQTPPPYRIKEFLLLASAVSIMICAGSILQRTGVMSSSSRDIDTDILRNTVTGEMMMPAPSGVITVPREKGVYRVLTGSAREENGLPAWIRITFTVRENGEVHCLAERITPQLLTIQKSERTYSAGDRVYVGIFDDVLTDSRSGSFREYLLKE